MRAKKEFESQHDELIAIVKRIKMRNDAINKKHGLESSTRQLIRDVTQDKEFVVKEVDRLHDIVKDMEQRYMDPDSVRKLDAIKREARKQLNRNEYLVKDLIRNFHEVHGEDAHFDKPAETAQKTPDKKNGHAAMSELASRSPQRQQKAAPKPSLQIQEEEFNEVDYEIEKSLDKEKTKLLQEFERSITQVNGIMNDIAGMTEKQGAQLDIITDEIFTTKKRVQLARENIEEANQHQKRSRLKYALFTLLIVLVVGLVIAFTVGGM